MVFSLMLKHLTYVFNSLCFLLNSISSQWKLACWPDASVYLLFPSVWGRSTSKGIFCALLLQGNFIYIHIFDNSWPNYYIFFVDVIIFTFSKVPINLLLYFSVLILLSVNFIGINSGHCMCIYLVWMQLLCYLFSIFLLLHLIMSHISALQKMKMKMNKSYAAF